MSLPPSLGSNRVSGRIGLPAPTSPDRQDRVRRFLTVHAITDELGGPLPAASCRPGQSSVTQVPDLPPELLQRRLVQDPQPQPVQRRLALGQLNRLLDPPLGLDQLPKSSANASQVEGEGRAGAELFDCRQQQLLRFLRALEPIQADRPVPPGSSGRFRSRSRSTGSLANNGLFGGGDAHAHGGRIAGGAELGQQVGLCRDRA